ncbi:proteasome subunit beta type-5 [Tanacetum coccineum]
MMKSCFQMIVDFSGLESIVPLYGGSYELLFDASSAAPAFDLPVTSNCDEYQKKSVQMVKPAKGTTTVAFTFKDGVMVAADSRASMGCHISSQSVKKVIELTPYLLGTMAGGAADCQFWLRTLGIECRLHELPNKRRISVTGASKLLANILYSYRGMGLSVGTMIAGWDEKGPGLYYVDSEGGRLKGTKLSVGSGSPYAYGVLDSGYRYDMTVDEAAELARRSIYHATFRDGASGGVASVYHVGPNGWTKLSGDDVGELHYSYYPVEPATVEPATVEHEMTEAVIGPLEALNVKHRQILDGPLMVNEVIQWCKRKKSKLMVFKIDFEKAFDSISWDFLLQVMRFMGFSEIWIKWISGCLHSASSSILINGSPTREFNIHRGLRQGDPLSPFLFIIAMERLHVAMEDAMAPGLYKGLKINTLNLSHLFFADDALFIGDWSRTNIKSLVSILDCFHRVSGLKINYHKSKLFGVGVPFDEVILLASITGCNALVSPFCYLGLPIDCNMALVKNWDPIVDKFSKSLSNWKASLLSIGALASKEKGGLGIDSLFSLNYALIQKWRWRFINNPHALWSRLIVAIYHMAPE